MMRVLFPTLVLVLVGCVDGSDDGGVDCTLESVVSVSVYVQASDGAPVDGAIVTYSVDGGEQQTADCMDDVCFVGYDTAGDFEITASYDWSSDDGCCWSNDSASASVTVEAGECHVEPQSVTITVDTDVTCVDQGDTGDCLP